METARDLTRHSAKAVSSDHFQLIFESGPGLQLVLTPKFDIVAVSAAYARATMTNAANIVGHGIFEVFPDDPSDPSATGVKNLRASLDRVVLLRQSDTMAVQKYPIRRPASQGGGFEERYWSPVNSPVFTGAGDLAYIIHRVEDVTDFIRLQQSGDEQDKVAAELRLRAERMESEIFLRAQEHAEANRRLSIANVSLRNLYEQVAILLEPDGHNDSEVRATPLSLEDVVSRITRLISSHKQMEEQLRQSQKMEAIGRLAGGVAHDFNNLLTVIGGYSTLVALDLPEGPILENVKEIESAAERAAALTTQLLAFSRKQPLRPVVLNLADALVNLEPMIRRLIGADIEVVMRFDEDVAPVKVDPSQLDQVFMNLVVNARDAMPMGGRLVVELRNCEVLESSNSPDGPTSGRYVMLSMRDNGIGMTPDIRQRVFDPFFTTKEAGKGTGLGLAVVYGVVRQSDGYIVVDSELGVGTTFKAYFPVAAEPLSVPPSELTASTARGTETILVVDDSPSICELVRQTLATAGYSVMVALSGESAIKLAQQYEGEIHLLLSDLVLPKVGGHQIAESVRSMRPGIKVIFMSGHPKEDRRANEATQSGAGFIQKPFRIEALRSRVRELLDAPRVIRRILIIDDEPAICVLLAAILRQAGYDVQTAHDGHNARETLRSKPVDLVITDLSMPRKDGIEIIRELRRDDPSLKIIAMSGAFGEDILHAAELLGANATLKKPLAADTLLECINGLPAR